MKLLLVDNNERVSQFVIKGLQEAGHTADHAANGRDGLFLAASEPYDVGVVGGFLIRRALLSRIHSIRQTVHAIMQGDLSHRLPSPQSGDELDTLSRTINRMLDQIEQLFHGIRDVSNAIAHDLRTPLAELRSRLEELSLTRPGVNETFAEVDAAVADVDRVMRIFKRVVDEIRHRLCEQQRVPSHGNGSRAAER